VELDLPALERLIKAEASVCYRLLRYLNSPIFGLKNEGLKNEIHSVRHALSLLGQREVRRWVRLVAAVGAGQEKPAIWSYPRWSARSLASFCSHSSRMAIPISFCSGCSLCSTPCSKCPCQTCSIAFPSITKPKRCCWASRAPSVRLSVDARARKRRMGSRRAVERQFPSRLRRSCRLLVACPAMGPRSLLRQLTARTWSDPSRRRYL
jgi:HDOD domain